MEANALTPLRPLLTKRRRCAGGMHHFAQHCPRCGNLIVTRSRRPKLHCRRCRQLGFGAGRG